MVTDRQVRILMKQLQRGRTLAGAAARADMDEKTARKYRRHGRLPSECRAAHRWRTRPDPFAEVWERVRQQLTDSPGLEAKTLFEALQREGPGGFADGQLRTLQRRVKTWRALEGPAKEVYFAQQHEPGKLCQSDFTHLGDLGITLAGQPFPHLLYHFVLTYSNWETGTVVFSESFESLSEGLENALWELGGVPREHRTDRLTAAVHKVEHPDEFTRAYEALLGHYGLEGRKIQAGQAHENGDVEQRHYRFQRALDQALLLRGSRDFTDRSAYAAFLAALFVRLNAGRRARWEEERQVLRSLPARRLGSARRFPVRVGPGSTIRVQKNVYSVHSRLREEVVEVRLTAEWVEVWYAQRRVEKLPRLRGEGKHRIDYRHVIDWLVRKPGAFENYRYREDLFPTSRFRQVYDQLKREAPLTASRQYLEVLELAARESESGVDDALRALLEEGRTISAAAVRERLAAATALPARTDVFIQEVDLGSYDALLEWVG